MGRRSSVNQQRAAVWRRAQRVLAGAAVLADRAAQTCQRGGAEVPPREVASEVASINAAPREAGASLHYLAICPSESVRRVTVALVLDEVAEVVYGGEDSAGGVTAGGQVHAQRGVLARVAALLTVGMGRLAGEVTGAANREETIGRVYHAANGLTGRAAELMRQLCTALPNVGDEQSVKVIFSARDVRRLINLVEGDEQRRFVIFRRNPGAKRWVKRVAADADGGQRADGEVAA